MTQTLTNTMREEKIDWAGGLKLFVQSWRPATRTRGVVALLNDLDKKNVMADIKTWINAHLPTA